MVLKMFLVSCLMVGFAFGYDTIPAEPSDFNAVVEMVMAAFSAFKAGSIGMGVGLIITLILGLMKMIPALKNAFDKLGAWKFIIPMALGAIAEIAFNLPSDLSFAAVVSLVVQGVQANGLVAIAFHHIISQFKKS
jgi:hypothetical protein